MVDLPKSPFKDHSGVGLSTLRATPSIALGQKTLSVIQLIQALQFPETRELALQLLSKNKGVHEDLACLLWNSFGTISMLLQEIISVYCSLSSPSFSERSSGRVCNVLALLQCVASHPDTRKQFIKANIPVYLYPFLNIVNKEKPYEFVRLTSLGVIGALVKTGNVEVVHFLLSTQIFPHCLRCMEVGNELSKTVATFIIHKILMHDEGLQYCCRIAERFYAVGHVLANMVEYLAKEPSPRLLKNIISCYLRLSQSPRACHALSRFFPMRLSDDTFVGFKDDPAAKSSFQQLMYNLVDGHIPTM
ncbi:hypothetical protein SLA2020_204070 [Shorea laevis]